MRVSGTAAKKPAVSKLKPTPPKYPPVPRGSASSSEGNAPIAAADSEPEESSPSEARDADTGEYNVLDRVATPQQYADIMQAYKRLGRLISALPVVKRP